MSDVWFVYYVTEREHVQRVSHPDNTLQPNGDNRDRQTHSQTRSAGDILHNNLARQQRQELQRPRILRRPDDQTVVEGDSIELHCEVTGSPTPRIFWRKNDLPLPRDSRFSLESSGTLRLEGLRNSDRGLYRCVVSNSQGSVSAFARVEVLG